MIKNYRVVWYLQEKKFLRIYIPSPRGEPICLLQGVVSGGLPNAYSSLPLNGEKQKYFTIAKKVHDCEPDWHRNTLAASTPEKLNWKSLKNVEKTDSNL